MRAVVLLAVSTAAAHPLQPLVDQIFKAYLPESHACPFERISQQCQLFNNTMTESHACHHACPHGDFACHFKCPMARPTSMKGLQEVAQAMQCHTACGHDKECHRSKCQCPFQKKVAACAQLLEVVECHKRGGDHSTCHLEQGAKELLLQEPWSLAKDVANHLVDRLLPVPKEQQATEEQVRSCHMGCGHDYSCHKACPTGPWGAVKEQCAAINTTHACHRECAAREIKCPVKKMSCHMKCPHMMPSSLGELKMAVDHMACHADCGKDAACHKACSLPELWIEKKAKCAEYDAMKACHKGCRGHGHICHQACPAFDFNGRAVHSMMSPPAAPFKELVSTLMI